MIPPTEPLLFDKKNVGRLVPLHEPAGAPRSVNERGVAYALKIVLPAYLARTVQLWTPAVEVKLNTEVEPERAVTTPSTSMSNPDAPIGGVHISEMFGPLTLARFAG